MAGALTGIMFAPFDPWEEHHSLSYTDSPPTLSRKRAHTGKGQPGSNLLAKTVTLSNGWSESKPTTLLAGMPWES